MAEEAILKVSLKEYKKAIDELRASLLSLESTDQQYVDTAEEIRERQSKLNEVMAIGKKQVEAIDGSYNDLSQQMSKLKKEWKDMVIGTQEWIDTAKQIDDLNNQLKNADAQVGVFTRNVGDYANSFEEAFKACIDGGKGLDGALGQNIGTVKKLYPLIKQTTSAATKGLGGVKKAIISTGVGALVVAVGLLVANWDKLLAAVQKFIPSIKKSREETDALVSSTNDLVEKNKELSGEIDFQARLMTAQGASIGAVTAYKRAETQAILDNVNAQIAETKAKLDSMKAHSAWTRFWKGENSQIKDLEESIKTLETEQTNLVNSLTKIDQDEAIEAAKKATDEAKKAADAAKKAREDTQKQQQAQADAIKKAQDEVLKRLKENTQTELDKLKEKYDEEKKLFEGNEAVLLQLEKEYQKNRQAIIDAAAEEEKEKANKAAKDIMDAANKRAEQDAKATTRHNKTTMDGNALTDANFKVEDDLLSKRIANLQTYMAAFQGTQEERMELEYQLTDLQAEQEDLRLQHTLDVIEQEKKAREEAAQNTMEHINNSVALVDGISSVMASAADMWEENINAQVKAGKLTESEAKKRFQQVKGMQIAVATMQMLAGITTALAGAFTTKSGPWDIALAAVQAAAIGAAGAVNIAKIKNTDMGSGGGAPSVVIPSIQETVPTVVANTTGQSDTENLQNALKNMTLEVKVTDIEAAQNRSQIRVNETTW